MFLVNKKDIRVDKKCLLTSSKKVFLALIHKLLTTYKNYLY